MTDAVGLPSEATFGPFSQGTDSLETSGQEANARNRRPPNLQSLNVLREGVAKVKDVTAEAVQREFTQFLETFTEESTGSQFYVEQIRHLRLNETTTLYVDYSHVLDMKRPLADSIQREFLRYDPYLRKAVFALVAKYDPDYVRKDTAGSENDKREFWVSWYGLPSPLKLRQLRTDSLGKLVCISGTVTRTSEVRPELLFGTFRCMDCGSIVRDVEQEFKYTEPSTCLQPTCNNRSDWQLVVEQSKFADWQKMRIQENPSEVPSGCMPRSMDIILRNDMVEHAKAGDKVLIFGTPIVVPDVAQLAGDRVQGQRVQDSNRRRDGFAMEGVSGLKALGVRDLTYKISFLGSFVRPVEAKNALNALHDMQGDDEDIERLLSQFTEAELNKIKEMMSDRLLMSKMTASICPHIFGHDNIKKGILLQLLGGVHKETPEGMRIRGDINVCVVGDPSCAKSQFLKYVSSIMPRAVYTSGKASSAAGLTASVVKDEETGEFTIEAGALMLADNGICCIDEFDKMDISDQVAIHEAMEQQTISIAKAGIHATLNARTSILAAANPVNGRYDKKLSLRANINMSAPIMSRFDLFFVILDANDETTDYNIGRHIVNFHRHLEHSIEPPYSQEEIIRYLKYARLLKPKMSKEAIHYLTKQYVQLRQNDAASNRNAYRITVRQLESMIRLSEALAKLFGADEVRTEHVKEAYTLLKTSIVHVDREDVEFDAADLAEDAQETAADGANAEQENMVMDTQGTADGQDAAQGKKPFAISFEEYMQISKFIIMQLRASRTAEEMAEEDATDTEGKRRSDLIDTWLEHLAEQDRLETEADYVEQRKIVRLVVKKMIQQDGILVALREEGNEKDPILVLHPNYSIPGLDD